MTRPRDADLFGHDPEAPDADALEQSTTVDDDELEELPGTGRRLPDHDLEAPEADALEQSESAPLDDDDRR